MLLSLLACVGPIQPIGPADAPTEAHLTLAGLPGKALAMRAQSGGSWSDGPKIELVMPANRWGTPNMTLLSGGRSRSGSRVAQLANGGTVTYDLGNTVDVRQSTSVLRGSLSLEGQTFDVHCTSYREAELGGANATWCLRVLASARIVDPKP